MKTTHILFDEPDNYKEINRYPYLGGSPKFVLFLEEYLNKYKNDISSISLAIYLFNNFELHRLFRKLAEGGVNVNVISIPLEGYDYSLPQNLTNDRGDNVLKNKHTKYSLANEIYRNFLEKPLKNYKLFIFPHTYLRSHRVKPFSRGEMPYSLHIKSMLIELNNGKIISGLTSSNLAMRDKVKHDFFLMKELNDEDTSASKHFFCHLGEASIPVDNLSSERVNTFSYPIQQKEFTMNLRNQFVAPFYAQSPEIAESSIINLMKEAKQRIWIMAQHISAFNYQVNLDYKIRKQTNAQKTNKGMLHTLLEKGSEGVDVVCLSQTFVDDTNAVSDYRKPMNRYNFLSFIREFKRLPNAKYFVNDGVHSKYIIVDNKVFVSTFNYTPTQFIYLPFVKIDRFEQIPGMKYEGVFSEVGQYIILDKRNEVECFRKNFEYVIANKKTRKVI